MKMLLTDNSQANRFMSVAWPKVKDALNSGKHLTIEIKQAEKSRDQEEKYHAMLGEIAQQAQHLGSKWDAESWKRLLVDAFCKQTGIKTGAIVPSLSGDGIVQLGFQTRKFTKEQASEFVEFLYAWGAENGITYSEV